ncbi:PrsW family intramembrane metalloprotease [Halobacteriales archaeon QH_7_65_31]|nr:MAG: PrsW family intramembrane metalloprotease [Halobacteriales archaeon QH_7_65_31]
MPADEDVLEERATGTRDLYDIATWEPRTVLDRLAVGLYRLGTLVFRALVVLLGLAIIVVQFVLGGIGATFAESPIAIALVAFSVIPALALAAYIYTSDVTTGEPAELLVGTFSLGVLLAGFAAVANSTLSAVGAIPAVGVVLFFYLVVGPVEESVKLLAVRIYAYRDDRFDAVVDGAVYGAAAGLGFATIENALYISRQLGMGTESVALVPVAIFGVSLEQVIGQGGGITAVRALAGPGHVIYSAFAGYYLGLAKFNREHFGPIVLKGLLIAAFIHGTYNVTAQVALGRLPGLFPDVPPFAFFLGFVLLYDGLFGYVLLRKLSRYRGVYRALDTSDADEQAAATLSPERTEFEE